MEKVTYIIPIHKYDTTIEKYLTQALESLKVLEGSEDGYLMFIGAKDIVKQCESLTKKIGCPQTLDSVDTDEQDIYSKINYGVNKCVTSYFSILEFDDEYYPYYNTCVQNVLERKERYSIIMPINELYSTDKRGISFMNEIAWDAAFSDNIGFINVEELKIFKDFNVTGAYIKTDDFIAVGGLKPSMKIAAWYEFLLRMAHYDKKIFILPRVGYKHTVLREDSYMVKSSQEIQQEEGVWLINYALGDFTNKEDSNKKYIKE